MNTGIKDQIQNYFHALDIAEKYIDISDLNENLKNNIIKSYHYSKEQIEREPKLSVINFFIKDLSQFWSYHVAIWVELFWKEVEEKKVKLNRTNNIVDIIKRGRFVRVGEAMVFKKNWLAVVASGYISDLYSKEQIEFVNKLILDDREKRLTLLKKSLRKEFVNWSDYLKYGEAIAYFTNGHLFNEYDENDEINSLFSKQEILILDKIWVLNEPKKR